MSNFSDFISGGGNASQVNETIDINSTANLITLADGRVYLKGGVTETDVATYPDATAALAYTGIFWVTYGQVTNEADIAYDGTYLWVLGSTNNAIYKYSTAGDYQNVTFSVASQDTDMFGVVIVGTDFYMVGTQNDKVYKYNSAGVFQSDFSIASQTTTAKGIAFDGTYLYVASGNGSASTIHKYSTAGTYQNVVYTITAQDNNVQGITWDGSFFWVCGRQNNSIYQYTAAGAYTGVTVSVAAQGTRPTGIVFGDSAYWVTQDTNGGVNKYINQIGVVSETGTPLTQGKQNYIRIK